MTPGHDHVVFGELQETLQCSFVMRDLSDVRVTLVICKKMTLSLYSNVYVDFVILLSPIQLTVIKLMTRRLHGQLPSLATDE